MRGFFFFFFFKQKTAYEMRISDWSSDVCSSDLDPDEQPDPQPPGGGEGAACCWSMALCGEAARDREPGHDHEEAPEPHRDAGEAVVDGSARGEAGEGRALVSRARGQGVAGLGDTDNGKAACRERGCK